MLILPALALLAAVLPPLDDVAQPVFSADGRYVAFAGDERLTEDSVAGLREVYLRDLAGGATILLSANSAGGGSGASFSPSISADGHLVAFVFLGHNLVGNDTNERADVFVRDWMAKKTTLVSVSAMTGQSAMGDSDQPAISSNGRYVVFRSAAPDLADINRRGTGSANGPSSNPRFDPAGHIVFESLATDLTDDVVAPGVSRLYARDLRTHHTILLSAPAASARRRGVAP